MLMHYGVVTELVSDRGRCYRQTADEMRRRPAGPRVRDAIAAGLRQLADRLDPATAELAAHAR